MNKTTTSSSRKRTVWAWVSLVLLVAVAVWWFSPFLMAVGLTSDLIPKGGTALTTPQSVSRAVPADAEITASKSNHQHAAVVTGQDRASNASPALQRMRGSRDWFRLFGQLDSAADLPLGDRLFAKALILDWCAAKAQIVGNYPLPPVDMPAGELAKHYSDPAQRAAAIEALERNVSRVCAGFGSTIISRQEVASAYAKAADAGDPRARAWLVGSSLFESGLRNGDRDPVARDEKKARGLSGASYADQPTDDQRRTLVAAIETKDPVAIHLAGQLLTHSSDTYSTRLGPNNIDFSERSSEVWTVVACQFGFECGPSNSEMLTSCSNERMCSTDYITWLKEYRLTPAEFDMVMQSAQILTEAVRTGNWSQVRVVGEGGRMRYIDSSPLRPRIR